MFETYDPERDHASCTRIWDETGWADRDDESDQQRLQDMWAGCKGWVARLSGEAECFVLTSNGSIRHQSSDLPFSGVMAVTTSRVARKQKLASRLTAHAVAADANEGAAVSGLGMFEQGFYNRLGFGSLPPQTVHTFDPARLTTPIPDRIPVRLNVRQDDASIHAARLARQRTHGSLNFDSLLITRGAACAGKKHFGLGFRNEDGTLGPHFVCRELPGENGPYAVQWISFQTYPELLELLGLIRSLGDAIRSVHLPSPPSVQIQDFLDGPIQQVIASAGGNHQKATRAMSWQQLRVCSVEQCVSALSIENESIEFNLVLTDPITRFLEDGQGWRGCGGEYWVRLASECEAKKAVANPDLPTLHASVNAFSRFWIGAATPEWLQVSEKFEGPPELIARLSRALCLPTPAYDWAF